MDEGEMLRAWRAGAGARILSWTVGNETPGTSTQETAMPETVMEKRGNVGDVNARNCNGRERNVGDVATRYWCWNSVRDSGG